MDTRSAITTALNTSMTVMGSYVSDFSAKDLEQFPGDGCNSIGWQLGHILVGQTGLLEMISPGSAPSLPEGFAEKYSKDTGSTIPDGGFPEVADFMKLFEPLNAAIVATVKGMTDSDLDQPGPERLRSMFPTVGDVLVLVAMHPMMHAGQIVPVRRKLGKPILI